MGSTTGSTAFCVEQLEQRRLLCGASADGAVGHVANGTLAADAVDAPAESAGQNSAAGHVVAAFARSNGGMRGGRVVLGETTVIDGATVATWAIVSKRDGRVMAAGATIPQGLAENQPQQGGSGPAGAIASLEFPAVVQGSTYFNHFELHTQPAGHAFSPAAANPNRYRPAHFDFHFYGVDEARVRAIPPGPPLAQVPPERLPAGYAQPGPSERQMGRHAGPASELTEAGAFSTVMIAGFTPAADQMHFLEPMVTREVLLQQEDFALPVPIPETFDRDTRYPTRFQAVFQGGTHHFVFSDFIDTGAKAEAAALDSSRLGPTGPAANDGRLRLQAVTTSQALFASSAGPGDGDDESAAGAGLAADLVN